MDFIQRLTNTHVGAGGTEPKKRESERIAIARGKSDGPRSRVLNGLSGREKGVGFNPEVSLGSGLT